MSESRVLRIFTFDRPLPGIRRWRGLALTEHGLAKFCWSVSSLFVVLSVEPTTAGLRLIRETEDDVLGPASLRYCLTRGDYKDYRAEWHLVHDRTLIACRLAELIAGWLGYKASEIPEEARRK
jgi:hypothetical protein